MAKRTFFVRAAWEAEAGAFVSESDIIGLHIEAATLDEFEDILKEVGPELIVANHLTAAELAEKPYEDLMPAILWQRPAEPVAA
ncbi:MAG: DUF1902 domain-containing protein [Mesorhizobium sp.]|nr:DUF1902 domain-containing protein [Mesorhizobium sp.]